MTSRDFTLRQAEADDFDRWLELYEAVAAEGRWIGGEAPVDRERLRKGFGERYVNEQDPSVMILAEASGALIGQVGVENHGGLADFGMMVASSWRGQGVGSALMTAAIEWAKRTDAHKMVLQVWPHNATARALYRKFGFVDEGVLRRHYRRRNGELWDAITMGLVLDTVSPGSSFDPA